MPQQPSPWDLVVVGAGAAGLLAAARAAQRGLRTLLVEKNRRPGVKILMSGGTRCNLTHNTDARGIIRAYGQQGKFLHSALAALSPQDLVALFHEEGVLTKVEETGKIFPVSDRAVDVLAALVRQAERSGVQLALSCPIEAIRRSEGGFQLLCGEQTIEAGRVLITTGGKSYPGCGTVGDGYRWAQEFGHTIVPPRPALVPITSNEGWVQSLKGVTIPDVEVRVLDGTQVLASRRSSLLFAHFGLSGPAAMDVSRAISGHEQPGSLKLSIDFLPGQTLHALEEWLRSQCQQAGKKTVLAAAIPEVLPRRLAESLLQQAELNPDTRCAELGKAAQKRLLTSLKAQLVSITGTRGFGKAEVTAGGVSLAEVDSRTMESRLVPGLYFAGEILDLDGPIGGFNFQAAFSTGYLAGESV